MNRIVCVLALVASFVLTSCFPYLGPAYGPDLPEVSGPESPEILGEARGTIVWVDRWDDDERLHVRDLRSGRQRAIELVGDPVGVSGPDADGNVAFLESSSWWTEEHRIVLVSLREGSSRTVLEGEGALHRGCEVSLAPRGGRIAFVRHVQEDSSRGSRPEFLLLESGRTTTIELEPGRTVATTPRWFPDARRLAFAERLGWSWTTWILDVETNARTRLGDGRIRALSEDGTTAFLEGEDSLRIVDVTTGNALDDEVFLEGPFDGPGSVEALVGDRLVIHAGLPQRGAEQKQILTQVMPGARYPLRLTEWSSGRSAVLISDTYLAPFSYAPFDVGADVDDSSHEHP